MFSSDSHFYSHYKDFVFNRIYKLIEKFNSFNIYKKIYFIDYSVFASASDCKIVDFSNYKLKKIGEFKNEVHIRTRFTKH